MSKLFTAMSYAFVLAAAAAASMLCACGALPPSEGTDTLQMTAETAAETEEEAEKMIDISVKSLYPTEKVSQTGLVSDNHSALGVFMAKNEREALQLVFSSKEDVGNLTLTCDCDIECELLRVAYVQCGDEKLPDPILPLKSGFKLLAGQNTAVIARFRTNEDTPPGKYEAVFTLSGGGETVSVTKASVTVWDFALPAESKCRTAFGLNRSFIENAHGVSGGEADEMYRRYYDYLLDNHVCAYSLPYNILDDRADAYMSDPRVNMFVVPYGSDDEIKSYHSKLSSNPDWFRKAVFYPLDEPTNPDMITKLIGIGERLSGLYPGYRMVTPFFTNIG
ncbi:MAG: hypothetical protein K6D94_08380, partial [Clostridiales bacterium]|nr:hypothetical protein [Clostridiales bacterium]